MGTIDGRNQSYRLGQTHLLRQSLVHCAVNPYCNPWTSFDGDFNCITTRTVPWSDSFISSTYGETRWIISALLLPLFLVEQQPAARVAVREITVRPRLALFEPSP